MRLFPTLCSLSALALTACLNDSADYGAAGFSISGSMEVLAIDRTAHTITTRTVSTVCQDDGTGVDSTETSLDHYAIKAGQLVLWNETKCDATLLSGSSTDILGAWTGTGIEMESAIPAEYRP